jgi:hypothetical protein
MTPSQTDQNTLVWTNPDGEEETPSLVYLRPGIVGLATLFDDDLEKAVAELLDGKDIAAQTIPLTKITCLSAEEGEAELSLFYQQTDTNTIQLEVSFADNAQRDEFINKLRDRLGPAWTSVRQQGSRFWACLVPLGALIFMAVITWFMYGEAEDIAAGKHLKERGSGKAKLFSMVMHWVEGLIGSTGVLIVNGLIAVLFLIYLVSVLKSPPIYNVVLPKEQKS